MSRRVSYNEIFRLAQRVFLATGAGAGCERGPALAAAWLSSHGLHGVETLHADCRVLAASVPDAWMDDESVVDSHPTLRLQAQGGSAAWIAEGVVDWVVAGDVDTVALVENVRSPVWFVPDVLARGGQSWLTVRDAVHGDPLMCAGAGVAAGGVALWCEPLELAGREAEVTLGRDAPASTLPGRPVRQWDAAELDRRHVDAVAHGVAVDEGTWRELTDIARQALVPESEQSRARGAGGGDANA